MEIKQMVNGLREQIGSQANVLSPRSPGHLSRSSPLDMTNLGKRIQESKRISRSLQDAFEGLLKSKILGDLNGLQIC